MVDYSNPITAFETGREIDLGSRQVSKVEIIEFAEEFDPAYFHLDEEAAKTSILGGLAASGFHICAIAMRMICDTFLLQSTSQGSPGVEVCHWLGPLRPGNTMMGKATVLESRVSRSRPNILIVKFEFLFWNENQENIVKWINAIMFEIPAKGKNE